MSDSTATLAGGMIGGAVLAIVGVTVCLLLYMQANCMDVTAFLQASAALGLTQHFDHHAVLCGLP